MPSFKHTQGDEEVVDDDEYTVIEGIENYISSSRVTYEKVHKIIDFFLGERPEDKDEGKVEHHEGKLAYFNAIVEGASKERDKLQLRLAKLASEIGSR
jgi:hypothetical protein